MELRTPININPSSVRINHKTSILTLGSCFANAIGNKLHQYKFKVNTNPFGVIFNPISIFKVLEASISNRDLFKDSYIQHDSIWYNYHLHSDYHGNSVEELQNTISKIFTEVHESLKSTDVITITLGTAFTYRLIKTNEIVANCHKIPAANFKKELLHTNDIVNEFEKVYESIKKTNPSIQLILTLSPVRHIKDGIEENSISKSILRTACHIIQRKYLEVEYFPSYEIMMDDLRDYRFYKEDMIHPSDQAETYIWEKFTEKYIDQKSQSLIKEWSTIQRAIQHRPFHPESDSYQTFLNETINKLQLLSSQINVEDELNLLQNKLKK